MLCVGEVAEDRVASPLRIELWMQFRGRGVCQGNQSQLLGVGEGSATLERCRENG